MEKYKELAQLPLPERNRGLLACVNDIYGKPHTGLPVNKDIPRLVRRIRVYGKDGTLLCPTNQDDPPADLIRNLIFNLSRQLDDEAQTQRFEAAWANHFAETSTDGTIIAKKLGAVINDPEVVGPVCRSMAVLKACNQSVIAPPWTILKVGLGEDLPFNKLSNTWVICIYLGENRDRARVTHEMTELIGREDEHDVSFKWRFSMEADLVTGKAVSTSLDLDEITVDPNVSRERAMEYRQAIGHHGYTVDSLQLPPGHPASPQQEVSRSCFNDPPPPPPSQPSAPINDGPSNQTDTNLDLSTGENTQPSGGGGQQYQSQHGTYSEPQTPRMTFRAESVLPWLLRTNRTSVLSGFDWMDQVVDVFLTLLLCQLGLRWGGAGLDAGKAFETIAIMVPLWWRWVSYHQALAHHRIPPTLSVGLGILFCLAMAYSSTGCKPTQPYPPGPAYLVPLMSVQCGVALVYMLTGIAQAKFSQCPVTSPLLLLFGAIPWLVYMGMYPSAPRDMRLILWYVSLGWDTLTQCAMPYGIPSRPGRSSTSLKAPPPTGMPFFSHRCGSMLTSLIGISAAGALMHTFQETPSNGDVSLYLNTLLGGLPPLFMGIVCTLDANARLEEYDDGEWVSSGAALLSGAQGLLVGGVVAGTQGTRLILAVTPQVASQETMVLLFLGWGLGLLSTVVMATAVQPTEAVRPEAVSAVYLPRHYRLLLRLLLGLCICLLSLVPHWSIPLLPLLSVAVLLAAVVFIDVWLDNPTVPRDATGVTEATPLLA